MKHAQAILKWAAYVLFDPNISVGEEKSLLKSCTTCSDMVSMMLLEKQI